MSKGSSFLARAMEQIPAQYRVGPWHPVAFATIATFLCALFLTAEYALSTYVPSPRASPHQSIDYLHVLQSGAAVDAEAPDTLVALVTSSLARLDLSSLAVSLQTFRLACFVYMALISAVLARFGGWVAMVSYTMCSWHLLMLRCIAAYAADGGWADAPAWVRTVADASRFPALVGNTVTVVVWWAVLTPIIHVCLQTPEQRTKFWSFNSNFLLVNIHLLNLPLAAIEFLASSHALTAFDLWVACAFAIAYMLFYLSVLDANGLHLYICFTPRTPLCALAYSSVLALYAGAFSFWQYGVVCTAQ